MALAIAASPAAQSNSTTTVSTNSFTPPAGSLMVAHVAVGNPTGAGTATTGTVTDSVGTTWTLKKRQNSTTGSGAAEIWMADAGASPAARTVTLTGSKAGVLLMVVLFTGAQPVATQTGATAASASSTNTLAITPTALGSYIGGSTSDAAVGYAMTAAASTTVYAAFNDATNAAAYSAWRSTTTTTATTSQTYGVTPAPANETEKVAVEILPAVFTATAGLTGSGTLAATASTPSPYRMYAGANGPSSAITDSAVNLAVEFYVTSAAANLTEIRWWQPTTNTNTATRQGALYLASDHSQVAVATAAAPSGTGWQTLTFATPVALTPNTRYRAVVLHPSGGYPSSGGYYASGSDEVNGPLVIPKAPNVTGTQGSYVYGAALAYTTNGSNNTFYWIDVTASAPPGAASAVLNGSGTLAATATPQCTAAFTGSGALTAATTPKTTRAAAFTGSGALTATSSLPAVQTLIDDFTTQDVTKWQGYDGTNVKVTYGQLQIAVDPAYYALTGQQAYSLVGSSAAVQAIQVPNAGNGSTEMSLQIGAGGTYASMMWNGGGLVARERVNSVIDDGAGGVSYDPAAMRWWRIRADATTTYWEYGPDGQTWTLLRSKASGFNMSSVTPKLTAGYWGTESNPGGAVFDNFNTIPAAPASPRTFYVDPSGSDAADGATAGTAWSSLGRVARVQLYPGDAVLFKRGGTWTGNLQPFGAGSAGAPVTIGAYGTGAAPIVSGGGASGVLGTYVPCEVYVPWMVLDGIEFRGSSYDDVTVYASDCTVQNCTIRWGSFGVSQRAGADRLKVLSNTITDVNVGRIGPGPDDDSGGCGVVLSGDGAEVAYNTISGCVFQSPDYGPDGSAVEIFAATNAVVHHNRSIDCVTFAELGDTSTANITFHTNVVTSTLAASSGLIIHGADTYGPVRGTKAYHNTMVVAAGGLAVWVGDGGEVDLRNNIVVVSGTADHTVLIGTTGLGMVEAGNVYWNPGDATGASVVIPGGMSATSIFANPLFVSTTDLRLGPGSPALDRGVNLGYATDYAGNARVSGAAPDSGAYEGAVGTPATGLRLRGGSDTTLRSHVALRAGTASAPFALSATAALSGAGSLTAVSQPTVTVAAALSGSGALLVSAGNAKAATATLAGSGSLVVAQTAVAVSATGALTGIGALAVTTRPALTRSAAFTGTGSLSAISGLTVLARATLYVATSGAWATRTPTRL